MSNSKNNEVKKFTTMDEFMHDPQFKIFEKNSLEKIVQIIKEFEIYPDPSVEDFRHGYSYRKHREHEDGLDLSSVDLAPRQSVKLVSELTLDNFGMIRLGEEKVKNGKDEKTVQTLWFNAHWSYNHFGGGSNGCGLFDVHFDVNGKVAGLRLEYEPRELKKARKHADHLEIHGTEHELKCAREDYKKARAKFMDQVDALVDKDNLVREARNEKPGQER